MARRGRAAKKGGGGMRVYFLSHATIPYIGIPEFIPQKHLNPSQAGEQMIVYIFKGTRQYLCETLPGLRQFA